MKLRRLNKAGRENFREWIGRRTLGELPPEDLLHGTELTEVLFEAEIDPEIKFASRFEFGKYISEVLGHEDQKRLLGQDFDGLWEWLIVVYFSQFGRKMSKAPHYSVTRRGHAGSLAYRHLARSAFEMFCRHRDDSLVMLYVNMSTLGDMAEQLTSRNNVAYHRGFIKAAHALYLSDGRLRRGSASRVRPPKRRKEGETIGRGGAGRLALAVRRLCRTYDTHVLGTEEMLALLPREFSVFIARHRNTLQLDPVNQTQ